VTRQRRRHTPEQIIRKLREADRLAGEGRDAAEVAKGIGGVRGDGVALAEPVRRFEGRLA
jgi:hypothetical protein